MVDPSTSNSTTVRQTIISNLEAPRLQGVATKHFTYFLKLRELYEKQISEKNRELGLTITPTSFKASIDDSLLKIFITAEWISATAVSEITEDELTKCIKERASFKPEGNDLFRIENIIRNVKMDMSLKEAEGRVWTLQYPYVTVLEAAGMQDLPEQKPHIAIKHILKRVKPPRLRTRMKNIVEWRKDEGFEKKDFGAFMRELAKQAKKLEEELETEGSQESDTDNSETDSGATRRHGGKSGQKNKQRVGKKRSRQDEEKTASSKDSPASKKAKADLPPCLNPKCDGHHFISKCPNSSEDVKDTLRKEYRERKKAGRRNRADIPASKPTNGGVKKGSLHRFGAEIIDSHSSLFSAYFFQGAVETVVLGDQGADTNVIPMAVFQKIRKADPNCPIQALNPPHIYTGIAALASLKAAPQPKPNILLCKKQVELDVHLRIRHGTQLVLRSVTWKIADTDLDCVIIGRQVLQALGCDNKAILAAACDQHNGIINIPEALERDSNLRHAQGSGTIASLLQSGTFHSSATEGDDGLEDTNEYIDLGDDDQSVIDEGVSNLVDKAKENGMSENGIVKLANLVEKYKQVFD
eukprot:gb/GEZJ01001057.1/.p1 GENE.gb/GEZJ01001057.1/~~gb/GEZJ01001057.1/.p1  ORF type:complete len:583 (-),score=92.79 gb/GEZJ01001057.1/:1849-3597(-)